MAKINSTEMRNVTIKSLGEILQVYIRNVAKLEVSKEDCQDLIVNYYVQSQNEGQWRKVDFIKAVRELAESTVTEIAVHRSCQSLLHAINCVPGWKLSDDVGDILPNAVAGFYTRIGLREAKDFVDFVIEVLS